MNLLVLRALGLGDLLTGIPALRALRRRYPAGHITLAMPDALSPLAQLTDAVDEIYVARGLDAVRPRGSDIDVAVNLHGRGPQSIRWLADVGPSELITHRHPDMPWWPGPRWRTDSHEIDRWVALVDPSGAHTDPADHLLAHPPVPSAHPGAVVVHPGASSPARRWRPADFAEVARALAADRHVVITGGTGERALTQTVAVGAGLPRGNDLGGRLGILGLAALIAEASVVISGDTGVAHLATAFATPSVVLFGPTDPARWGPPSSPPHRVLWAGRTGDPHARAPFPGLLAIRPSDVISAVTQLDHRVRHG